MAALYPLAWSTLGSPGWSFEHTVEQAAANGYAALEVRMLDGQIIPVDLPPERRRQMKAVLQQHQIKLIGLGLSTRFSSPDPAERMANVELLRRYIELANDLEAPMVRTFGGNIVAGQTLDQTIDWVAQGLLGGVATAEAQGVTIVLETHDAFCRGAEVARVLAQVDSPAVAAVWDLHHPFRMGESIEETWQLIGPRVKHVHVKDGLKQADGSWRLVLLGEGELPCRTAIQWLYAQGYRGYLSAEWEKQWHPAIEEPEVAMPQHAQVLRQWMSELGQ
ncbi:MAG: sugar phosphate isomerase/epimerase [Caldilineaceae bacterium]|nr:sugar phosphate isomerase/epimerase [Caldilineaceae bacterium]